MINTAHTNGKAQNIDISAECDDLLSHQSS